MPVVRSTVAPFAAQISWARADGNRTPTRSMTSSVAVWIRRMAAGERIWSRGRASKPVAVAVVSKVPPAGLRARRLGGSAPCEGPSVLSCV